MIKVKRFIAPFAFAALLFTGAQPADAHPLDVLGQFLAVQLGAQTTHLSLSIGGGMLANEMVMHDLDANGDMTVSKSELAHWQDLIARDVEITLDGKRVAIDGSKLSVSIPPSLQDFHLGLAPIIVTFSVPMPAQTGSKPHRLAFTNNYQPDLAKYGIQVQSAANAQMTDQGWPAKTIQIAFTTDPGIAAGASVSSAAAAANAWSANRIVKQASDLLNHKRTPLFLLVMAAVFIGLGALHALQPGHGKTLVAAYLVATGGTTRDALMLALVVTFTHTISVFALGFATLAASQFLLPSRVVPVMGVISGLIVAVMGASMLWNARKRAKKAAPAGHDHHDHALLTDEEHARLHLEEALEARKGVSKRRLITLGVSGGLAPCSDALAILLLSIGMGQGMIGLFAIVAFSLGLAGMLVVFGFAIVLAAPVWRRFRSSASGSQALAAAFSRLAQAAPLLSGAVILVFGIAMAWSSVIRG